MPEGKVCENNKAKRCLVLVDPTTKCECGREIASVQLSKATSGIRSRMSVFQ
jgi:hypothetical protein